MGTRGELFSWLAVIFIVGLGLGLIAPRLLAWLFDFIAVKSDFIQGLADFIQIGIWLATAIVVWLTYVRGNKKPVPTITTVFKDHSRAINTQTYIEQQIVNTPAGDAGKLREAYLSYLFESCRQLSLAGIDPTVASKAETRLHLDGVYTALLTLAPEMHERLERGEKLEKETRRLSALEQFNLHKRLVLLGDPGSGKSTFVNFVALCLAGEALQRQDANIALLTAPLPVEKANEKEKPQPCGGRIS